MTSTVSRVSLVLVFRDRLSYRPLQDDSPNKVFLRSVVCNTSIHEDRREDIGKSVHVDAMEVIDPIESARVSRIPEIGDVGFREEVGDICCGVDDGSSGDANGVWDISAADVRLEERRMHLSRIQYNTSLCVHGPYVVLR